MLYKLTESDGTTRNKTQWGENITHTATGSGTELCSDGFIHAYENPLIAVLMNPAHGGFENPKMWEAEGDILVKDSCLKCGVKTLTTLREIPVPEISTEQRVTIAIKVSLLVYHDPSYVEWATKWLSGEDRTEEAATASFAAHVSAVAASVFAASDDHAASSYAAASCVAASAASDAASAASDLAASSVASDATLAAADASDAAFYAACVAAHASAVAAYASAGVDFDLLGVIQEVMSYIGRVW